MSNQKSDKSKTEDKSDKSKTEDKGGLKIVNLDVETVGAQVRPNQRMWLTADGKALVPDGHEEAATLYCSGGNRVSAAEFESLEKIGFEIADSD